MKSRVILIIILICTKLSTLYGQVLHTESFAVILDTTRLVKGNIVPSFNFQNLKKDLIEFENTTDISFRIKKSAITIANHIEFSKYGKESLLSGGFLYLEYRKIFDSNFVLEPFSQIHWSEARGLEFKYAGGINLRYRIYFKNRIGFYAGMGPFYEYEKWNYDGVEDNLIPMNPENIVTEKIKLGSYLSFKWKTSFNLDFDFSLYHQSTYNDFVDSPRLASSSSLKYNFTEHLGLIFQYQNIYDYKPSVPIDKLYNHFITSIEVSF